jgi:hypothetical protein
VFGPRLTVGDETLTRVEVGNIEGDAELVIVDVPPLRDPPGAPRIIRTAVAGSHRAAVSWTAPTFDGASPIVGYI